MEWADTTIYRLRTLWDEGLSTAAIGRQLGVSKNAVVGKAHRLDLPARPSPIRRDGHPAAARYPTIRRVAGPTLPLLACLARVEVSPASKPMVPRITHPKAATERPTAATSVRHGPVCECRWPMGEPGTRSFRFCDDPSEPGRPYCTEHVKLAYIRVRDRREDEAA